MIELPTLSYKHRPEPFCNGVYEIDSKRGEIGNQNFLSSSHEFGESCFSPVPELSFIYPPPYGGG